MFSDLSSQVSSWMTPGLNNNAEENDGNPTVNDEPEVNASPKSDKINVLTNVKNRIEGWFESGIPLLNKSEESDNKEGEISDGTSKEVNSKFEFDIKAMTSAKSIGSFISLSLNKAGKTVSEVGIKIKKNVEENTIIGKFNKELDAFLRNRQVKIKDVGIPPWTGQPNEELLKEYCLNLSLDKRNFIRNPPPGVDFQFDYEESYPVALAVMAEDPNLERIRFELVPKVVKEEQFWLNYFYRVGLICHNRTFDCEDQIEEGINKLNLSDQAEIEKTRWEKELENELQDYEIVDDVDDKCSKDKQWNIEVEDLLDST